jgi:hypothetical protein
VELAEPLTPELVEASEGEDEGAEAEAEEDQNNSG